MLAGTYHFKVTIGGIESAGSTLVVLNQTVSVGAASGSFKITTSGNVNYAITTTNMADGQGATVKWYTDNTYATTTGAPQGITPSSPTVSSNSLTLNMAGDGSTPMVAGTYYFTVTIDNIESAGSTLVVLDQTVTVGAASGSFKITTSGNVQYAITTTNMADGQGVTVKWYTDNTYATTTGAPQGITPSSPTVSSNSLTLNMAGDGSTPMVAGTYYFTVTVDNIESVGSTLVVLTQTVTIASTPNSFNPSVGGNIDYGITTSNIADGQGGTVTWYTDGSKLSTTSAPTGIITNTPTVASNTATLWVNGTPTLTTGTYYFTVTFDNIESNVETVIVN